MSEAGTPKRRNVWLIASLCLNIVLIAMIAVGIARAWHPERDMRLSHVFSVDSIMAYLPADRAAKVQAIVAAHAARMKWLADDAVKARLEARPVFAAQPFDPEAYAKVQDRMRKADDAFTGEKLKQLSEIAALLTPAERRDIVDRAKRKGPPPRRQ